MHATTNTGSRYTSDLTIGDFILSSGQPLRYLDFPTRPHRQTPGHTNQGESSKHVRHFLFSFLNMSRFSELTPVRRQGEGGRLPTLDASDITLLLEWTSTFTRESRKRERGWPRLESHNERRGTWSLRVGGRGAPWFRGGRRRRGRRAGSLRSGSRVRGHDSRDSQSNEFVARGGRGFPSHVGERVP